jgi:hypothetical protein
MSNRRKINWSPNTNNYCPIPRKITIGLKAKWEAALEA